MSTEIEDKHKIIRKLIVARYAAGMSQTQVAKAMGCQQGRVSRLERTRDELLRLGEIRMFAKAVGLDVRELIDG